MTTTTMNNPISIHEARRTADRIIDQLIAEQRDLATVTLDEMKLRLHAALFDVADGDDVP